MIYLVIHLRVVPTQMESVKSDLSRRHRIYHVPHQNYRKAFIQSTATKPPLKLPSLVKHLSNSPPNHTITREQFYHYFQSLAGGDFNYEHQHFGCRVTDPRKSVPYDVITFNKYF